ncbi:MAG: hypothetical protein P0Y53_23535 [Candidatus Pseudobacter hemicellulosilyticus]|uniref:Uncharacterized protein n=1 Tax=Candidatus Pseudobacter hemicellulosilyticus TaxID=3121375 RepID=A0AAJ5WW50_9BACT|nr:MAG: hypothetical protein P0Y53_23535 [Pseudobacter sp.]
MSTVLTVTAFWVLLTSSMNNDPDPKKPLAAAELQKNIQGKWLFRGLSLEGMSAPSAVSSTIHHSFTPLANRFHLQLNGTIVDAGLPTREAKSGTGFIEFLSDSTYMIYDAGGRFITGSFHAETGDSISLNCFGSLSSINMADGNLQVRICHSGKLPPVLVSGTKEAPLPEEERTAILCRNWYLSTEGNGDDVLGESLYMTEKGRLQTFFQDSIACAFTPSGTFLMQRFEKGVLKSAGIANWKWHPTEPNRFIYYRYDKPIDDNRSARLKELNPVLLKMQELVDENEDGMDEEWNWVLRPAR